LYSLASDDLDQVVGVLHRLFCKADPAHPAAATMRRGTATGGPTP
jgi:hypothetical protein